MAPTTATDTSADILKRIETPLRLTLAGLWAERVSRAFWPLWSLLIVSIATLAFGVQDHLPLEGFWIGAVAVILGLGWALWSGWRQFRRPTRAEALVRIDASLPGQPLAALNDTQAIGLQDPASRAVWDAHRARMAARAAGAKAVEPDLRLASRDRYALRYVALTALVMAVLFGSLWRVGSVAGLTPGGAVAATGPTWEGWAQPPAYTGKPTLYLNDQTAEALTLPAGTRIQLRFYGEPGNLILSETVSARTEVPPASEPSQDFLVTQSGQISIEGTGGRDWKIEVTKDTPPIVALEGEIGREADGRFKQNFSASDDYGVVKGQVTVALDLDKIDRRFGLILDPETVEPVVLDLPLPVTGDRAKFKSTLIDDLSKSVLANLPVTLSFTVSDAASQSGQAEIHHVTLPGKRFFDPLAAALIEMRRDLLWNRANAPRAVQILKAITYKPEGFIRNERAYLRLRVALKRLEAESANLTPTARDEVVEELWQIALLVEEGDLASALERLRRAQDRLDEAIRNGASPEEVQELMDEMRQALDQYLKQLAQDAERRGEDAQTSENGQQMQMSQDQLQQMLDKLQQLMDEGKTAEAAELMEQLRQFMENMQVTQGGEGQGQGGPGQQAMRDLGKTLRDQQGLSDDSFRDLQNGQEGEQGLPRPGEDGGKSLAERQEELRKNLERLGRDGRLPGEGKGAEGREELDRSREAMEEAERALREGDLPGALDRQAEAMDALREGIRRFGEALAENNRQEGQAPQGEQTGRDNPEEGRDPLGRQLGESARIGSDRNMLQGKDVYRRAEELLDEIRRRSGEQARPEGERDYLKRLLDLF